MSLSSDIRCRTSSSLCTWALLSSPHPQAGGVLGAGSTHPHTHTRIVQHIRVHSMHISERGGRDGPASRTAARRCGPIDGTLVAVRCIVRDSGGIYGVLCYQGLSGAFMGVRLNLSEVLQGTLGALLTSLI